MVQICQELGQPYEEYNAQFLRLKRQQEANEDQGFEFRQEEAEYPQQNIYQPENRGYQPAQDDEEERYRPRGGGQGMPKGRAEAQDEGFGNDDLLPD